MFNKIQWKIFFVQLVLTVVTVASGGYYIYRRVEANELKQLEQQLVTGIDLAIIFIPGNAIETGDINQIDRFCDEISHTINVRATFIAPDGTVLGESDRDVTDLKNLENHLNRPEIQMALSQGLGSTIRHSVTVHDDLLYVVKPVIAKGNHYGFLRFAFTLVQVRERLAATKRYIWLGGILGVMAGLLIAWVVSGLIAQPILTLKEVVAKVGKNEFSVKIPFLYRKDEIGELSRGVKQMAQDLDRDIRRIQQEGNKIQSIIANMSEGVLVLDGQLRIILINESARRMFEVAEGEVRERPLLEVIRNFQISGLAERCKKTGEFQSVTIDLFHPIPYSLLLSAVPMKGTDEEAGILLVVKDVTELKRLDRIKSDFVANASHELKTPLTSIKGYVETLLETDLEDKETHKKFLPKILNNVERLEALLFDMLELSRIEAMTGEEERVPVPLQPFVQRIAETLKERIDSKRIRCQVEIPQDSKVRVIPHLLEQAITNLLDNAVKYTSPGGKIQIGYLNREGQTEIRISDSGVGISRQHIQRIFERFYVVDEARSKEMGGTGLGLAIVKNAVEALKGTVEVDSEVGVGTTFKVILPKS